jgi:hypothetical protein
MTGPSFNGWLPIGVSWSGGQPEIDWCLAGPQPLSEPFFEDSVVRLVRRPFNKVFRRRTGSDELEAWAIQQPGLTPSGFIFHMSRCGSTLAAQMLAARSDSVVLSEPAPIDSMLRPPTPIPDDQHVNWLRALVSAMAHPRLGLERYCIIKFDCWHTLSLPLIRRAFPAVPWVFLYRDPRAVLASHLRQRGVQTVPGLVDSRVFGIEPTAAARMPGPESCARVLGTICESAARTQGGALLNYRQLPAAVFDVILPRFGMPADPADRAAMEAAAANHSKRPGLVFSPADDAPPLPPGPMDTIIDAFLADPYRVLEQRRVANGTDSSM